jgi:hypothetical protein
MGKSTSDHSLELIIIPIAAILGWPFIIAFGLISLENKIKGGFILAGLALLIVGTLCVAWFGKFSGYCTVGLVVAVLSFIVWLLNLAVNED